ncbi:MAG: DUF1775 domain-containing protein [Pseudomonadota bacterium]|nr:DUF1775 domain-containing protein [Pseudomonadota bacterium]
MKHSVLAVLALSILPVLPATLNAHASLEVKEAPQNTNYKAVMRIPHGCDGQATQSVSITIPEGVINTKPMPKAGWELTTEVGAYAKTYEYHGPRSEGVQKITWTGNLENDHYDEFVFRARITDAFAPGEVIYFPTVQLCADGSQEWVELPVKGKEGERLKKPAPSLTVTEGAHKHHH